MNVLILTVVSGFLQKFLMQDVQMLIERGYAVHYATNFDTPIYECNKEELENMGISCYHIPIRKSPLSLKANYSALSKLKTIVKEQSIDFIYMHNPVGGVLGRLLTFTNKKIVTIYTAHGFHFYKGAPWINWMLYYPIEKYLARKTNALITINHEDEARANTFSLRKNGFVKRIHSTGIDNNRFYYDAEQKESLRNQYGIDKNSFVLLSVGELNNNKNHKVIIKAFAEAKLKDAQLLICGEGINGFNLHKLITNLGLEGQVKLCGYQTRIEDYYRMADVFMFPSIREGMGMAALEAMACGLPLIVSDNRGSREYARENAYVCDAKNVKAFTEAIICLYNDSCQREEMSHASVKIAGEFYKNQTRKDMEEVMDRLEEQYGR